MNKCSINGCNRRKQARGLCNTHYWRWNTYGDANYEGPSKRKRRIIVEAKESGKTTYETGEPCKRGHVAPRYFAGRCVECDKIRMRAKYREDPTKQLAACAKWRAANLDYHNAIIAAWDKKNRARKNEHSAKSRALEKQAMPVWADRAAIRAIYKEAHERGMVVDHVIPLSNKFVSGLHVAANLQLLSAEKNKRKHNKFDHTVVWRNAAGTIV